MKTFFYYTLVILLSITSTVLHGQKTPMTQEQYDNSLALFEAGKKEYNNSYEFALAFTSFSGNWSKTFFVVEEGKVVERRYLTGDYDDKKNKETVHWIEKGDSLGTHSEGKAIMTMDKLYEIGKGSIGQPMKEDLKFPVLDNGDEAPPFSIIRFYGFDLNGLLYLVGSQHASCVDDCFQGYHMTDFEWKKKLASGKTKRKKNKKKK